MRGVLLAGMIAMLVAACTGAASPSVPAPVATGAPSPATPVAGTPRRSAAPVPTAAAPSGASGAVLDVSPSGRYLVAVGGLTLYAFFPSGVGGPTGFAPRVAYGDYTPFNVPSGTLPVLGPGVVASKVGTAPDPNQAGKIIVTYGGAPLYYCSVPGLIQQPGDTSCTSQNFQVLAP